MKTLKLIAIILGYTLTFSVVNCTEFEKEEFTAENLMRFLSQHQQNCLDSLERGRGANIVVFLGKTGAGKSTLINYLSDKEIEVNEDGYLYSVTPDALEIEHGRVLRA